MTRPSSSYEGWSREELISRLAELERPKRRPKYRSPSPTSKKKPFDFTSHARRKIALKFCYSGWDYNGLAFQTSKTPLPTVEGVLFNALAKARLIDPQAGFDGCGWEKCGRTDRGVSAAGQVISLWVRSAVASKTSDDVTLDTTEGSDLDINHTLSKATKIEHDYLTILNRLLPSTIRILAWSPVSTTFSARFSCTYRHYKYFFSPAAIQGPALNIDRMRIAASYLVGEHDFRNLCKLDPGKQITMFKRNIRRADIEPLNGVQHENGQGMHVFNLVGSAFLYHQVRHIMAILFLVGSGLEDPSVVSALMNVEEGLEEDRHGGDEFTENAPQRSVEIVDRKPVYQMADALPLLLWDCGYPEDELNWRTMSAEDESIPSGSGVTDVYQHLHSIYSRSQVYTVLNNHFLTAASGHYFRSSSQSSPIGRSSTALSAPIVLSIPLGGGTYKRTGQTKYLPLLERDRLDAVEAVNERWRLGKGSRRNDKRRAVVVDVAEELDGNE